MAATPESTILFGSLLTIQRSPSEGLKESVDAVLDRTIMYEMYASRAIFQVLGAAKAESWMKNDTCIL